jgi:flagella basal body P-ring formation protein FlgA
MSARFVLGCLLAMLATAAFATDVDGVVDAARAAVVARLGEGQPAALTVIGRPAAPPGDTSLKVLPVAGRFPRERFAVDVLYVRQGKAVGRGTVGFALSLAGEGWVYAEDGRPHEDAALLRLVRGQVDAAHRVPVDPAAVEGMRLKRNVRSGQALSLADFETVPDVDNRQAVRLRAAFGGITLESAGMALRSGNKGEIVTVQVPGATEPVKATVIDRGVAELVQ